jgi:hypothetical protein
MKRICCFALISILAACSSNLRSGGGGGGGNGGSGGGGGGGGSGDGGSDGCAASAKLVYVIDQNGTLSSFLPNQTDVTQSTFTTVGKLNCPASPGANPFSMSVDRSGTAWVEYVDVNPLTGSFMGAQLFKVSTTDASCTATSYTAPQQGFDEFGMGFVSNSSGSTDETLFIAGGGVPDALGNTPATNLGTLDVGTLMITKGAMLNGRPELTGTGDAKLWAFFPDATNPRVTQLDKNSGQEIMTFPVTGAAGMPMAWAFAFYGGDYWVFLQRAMDSSTIVYRVKGADGSVTTAPQPGRTIVGAGVSTCAPTQPIS